MSDRDDLVKRLREMANEQSDAVLGCDASDLFREAADEIQRVSSEARTLLHTADVWQKRAEVAERERDEYMSLVVETEGQKLIAEARALAAPREMVGTLEAKLTGALRARFGIGYWRAADEGFSEDVIQEIVACVAVALHAPVPARPAETPQQSCPACGHSAHWEACINLNPDGYCHCNYGTAEARRHP